MDLLTSLLNWLLAHPWQSVGIHCGLGLFLGLFGVFLGNKDFIDVAGEFTNASKWKHFVAIMMWPMTNAGLFLGEGIEPPICSIEWPKYLLTMTVIGPWPKIIFNIGALAFVAGPWIAEHILNTICGVINLLMSIILFCLPGSECWRGGRLKK